MAYSEVTSMYGYVSYSCDHCQFVTPHVLVMEKHDGEHTLAFSQTVGTGLFSEFGEEITRTDVNIPERVETAGEVQADHLGA